MLEFKPADGYEKLCMFLGKPLPMETREFPHVNQPDDIIKIHRGL